ncbi:hypothetical protein VTJ04DRAFT_5785 [Mycothermus thermophilus]|uniref:uncharacterized protein n=1 Tax=Humicola insolens TaxID=85995 RepID=UPI003742D82A
MSFNNTKASGMKAVFGASMPSNPLPTIKTGSPGPSPLASERALGSTKQDSAPQPTGAKTMNGNPGDTSATAGKGGALSNVDLPAQKNGTIRTTNRSSKSETPASGPTSVKVGPSSGSGPTPRVATRSRPAQRRGKQQGNSDPAQAMGDPNAMKVVVDESEKLVGSHKDNVASVAQFLNEAEEILERLKAAEQQKADLEKRLKEEERNRQAAEESAASLNDKLAKEQRQRETAENNVASLKEKLAEEQRNAASLSNKLAEEQHQRETAANNAASLEERVKELTKIQGQMEKQVAAINSAKDNLAKELEIAQQEIQRLSESHETEKNRLLDNVNKVAGERDDLKKSLSSVNEELEAVKKTKANVEKKFEEEREKMLAQIQQLEDDRDQLMTEVDNLNDDLDAVWEEYDNYKLTLSEPQKKLIDITKQLADSNALLESLLKRTAMVRAK